MGDFLPWGDCTEVEENADFLVGQGGNCETDAASEDRAPVEGILPFERNLDFLCGDLLFQLYDLVIVAERQMLDCSGRIIDGEVVNLLCNGIVGGFSPVFSSDSNWILAKFLKFLKGRWYIDWIVWRWIGRSYQILQGFWNINVRALFGGDV